MKPAALLSMLALAAPAYAALPPNTVVALYVAGLPATGEIADGAPPRFVLLEDGRVFVGGTSTVSSAKLSGKDLKPVNEPLSRARKVGARPGTVTLGPGTQQYRLVRKGQPDVLTQGDPARAAGTDRPLGVLIDAMLAFDHPALRPLVPESYLASLRPDALPGGCREWHLPVKPADLKTRPAVVPASSVVGSGVGVRSGSALHGDAAAAAARRDAIGAKGWIPDESVL
jgi:hypothetical protein